MLVIRPVAETPGSSTSGRWMSEDGRYLILRSERGRHWYPQGRDAEAIEALKQLASDEFPSRQAAAKAIAALLGQTDVEVSHVKGQLPLVIVEQTAARHRSKPRPVPAEMAERQLSLDLKSGRWKRLYQQLRALLRRDC